MANLIGVVVKTLPKRIGAKRFSGASDIQFRCFVNGADSARGFISNRLVKKTCYAFAVHALRQKPNNGDAYCFVRSYSIPPARSQWIGCVQMLPQLDRTDYRKAQALSLQKLSTKGVRRLRRLDQIRRVVLDGVHGFGHRTEHEILMGVGGYDLL